MLIGDYWFDFEKMEAYRYMDYLNMNLATTKISILLTLENGCVKKLRGKDDGRFFGGVHMNAVLNEAYNEWITEQIEKIVL